MKYEYLKGSEKDFEVAPEWAELIYIGDVKCFVGRDGRWKNESSNIIFNDFAACSIPVRLGLIAERRPITEPVWGGVGLHQVGCERVAMIGNPTAVGRAWRKVKVVHVGTPISKSEALVFDVETTYPSWSDELRPLSTEADKNREAICTAIYGALTKAEREHNRSDEADAVYDAIAAGKIPGVKLED